MFHADLNRYIYISIPNFDFRRFFLYIKKKSALNRWFNRYLVDFLTTTKNLCNLREITKFYLFENFQDKKRGVQKELDSLFVL